MKPQVRAVVFCDVGGGHVEPSADSCAAAANILKELSRENVPLILCSSKTRAELEEIQAQLGICHPFVCENGGALFIPPGYFDFDVPSARDIAGYQAVEFGRPYAEVVRILHRAAEALRLDLVGFSDMSVEEIALECRVTLLRARLAKLRQYDEPFRILEPSPRARRRLVKALNAAHLRCIRVGRYDHVGAAVDMEIAVNLLCTLYRRTNDSLLTLGWMDPVGDDNLLQVVDYSILSHDDTLDDGMDIVKWAQMIVKGVRELGRRGTSAFRSGSSRETRA